MRYDALHDMLAQSNTINVGSGNGVRDAITDRHITRNAPTVRLRTRRGLVLEGAEEHKLSIGHDQWIALKDVQVGQRIPLSVGNNIWSQELVSIVVPAHVSLPTSHDVAVMAGVGADTVYRYLDGAGTMSDARIAVAIAQ